MDKSTELQRTNLERIAIKKCSRKFREDKSTELQKTNLERTEIEECSRKV